MIFRLSHQYLTNANSWKYKCWDHISSQRTGPIEKEDKISAIVDPSPNRSRTFVYLHIILVPSTYTCMQYWSNICSYANITPHADQKYLRLKGRHLSIILTSDGFRVQQRTVIWTHPRLPPSISVLPSVWKWVNHLFHRKLGGLGYDLDFVRVLGENLRHRNAGLRWHAFIHRSMHRSRVL